MVSDQNQSETFFTIIIPTRERCDTLVHTIKTALSQDYNNYQILVSDNASSDLTYEKVNSIQDPRVNYINTGSRVSMSENWEFALDNVNKGWVTILGDDDAILPGTLQKVNQLARKHKINAIRSNGCTYRWPGFNGSKYGTLNLSVKKGYEIRNSAKMLQQVLDGTRHYNELPMLYNGGFVSVDLIKKVKSITGKFFQSMTPDVYSAIVFSFLTREYIYSHEAFAINGASLHSGGTAGFEIVKQKRSYDPAEKFLSEKNIPFHPELPLNRSGRPVRSLQACVYEAYLQAEQFHGFHDVKTDHASQLRLIIEKSGPDHLEIVDWTEQFTELHNLELPHKLLNTLAWKLQILSFLRRLKNGLFSYTLLGSSLSPIFNVSEAAIIAGNLKELNPSLVYRLGHHFKNRTTKT